MSRLLILGASGYLGSKIVENGKKQGWEVTGTCFQNLHAQYSQVDLREESACAELLRQANPDVVIWAVMSGENETALIQKGLSGVLSHISPATRLLFVSTDGVFEGAQGPYQERDAPSFWNRDSSLAAYCNAKLAGEEMVRSGHLDHAIVRSGPIYGPDADGRWDNRVRQLTEAWEKGERVVRSSNVLRTFIHVDDLADALLELAGSEWTGTLHVGPSSFESYYTFAQKTALRFGYDPALVEEDQISREDAANKGIKLDLRLDTSLACRSLHTSFRSV
ncbi:sugar nucleotide-binding protein [Brevibacillus borstelensis]|uniref:sugar nucleotide-binding protein n=1 Tax=Brevibacillus borstelensis TaxID=45462 RepID=UPI001561B2CF|nr:sugar nucleotide-binding protein [Brevibacillus borstelensis]MBE5397585.1 sugar nucleotide-binding protein [Brevibacillus borstelensis]WNF04584.1 sugar nucleotide-binding protein [Brevibacillus borstelensis]